MVSWSGEGCATCATVPLTLKTVCAENLVVASVWWAATCATVPLTLKTVCYREPGGCECVVGWSGEGCTTCATIPLTLKTVCYRQPGGCECVVGWSGEGCATSATVPLTLKTVCYREPGGCECVVGWSGEGCATCAPYPGCANGGCSQPWECNCQVIKRNRLGFGVFGPGHRGLWVTAVQSQDF